MITTRPTWPDIAVVALVAAAVIVAVVGGLAWWLDAPDPADPVWPVVYRIVQPEDLDR